MKSTLSFIFTSMVFASPMALGKTEIETLRARCAEQERQIRLLEEENSKLRGPANPEASTPAKKEEVQAAAKAPEAPKPAAPVKSTTAGTYKVKAGDHIEKIARIVGSKPETLAKFNGIKTSSILQIGQILKIPGKTVSTPAKTAAAPVPEKKSSPAAPTTETVSAQKSQPTAEPQTKSEAVAKAPEPVAAEKTQKIRPITIDGEMTYGEFATKHGTNPERLNALNGLDLTTSTVLAKGSELYVPTLP